MIVLKVNGEAIEEPAIQEEAAAVFKLINANLEDQEDPQIRKQRAHEWAEENLIEAALMRQAAVTEPDEEPAAKLERLMARIADAVSPPRRKDVVAYYLKNRESFNSAESVHAAHIVKNVDEQNTEDAARAGIEKVREELATGRPFAEVADELSDCPGKGGDLGVFGRGDMVSGFEQVVFPMKVNEVSGIFRTEFGFHIATVLAHIPAGMRPLEDVQAHIEEHLLQEKKQKRLHQYIDSLRARAVVEREVC